MHFYLFIMQLSASCRCTNEQMVGIIQRRKKGFIRRTGRKDKLLIYLSHIKSLFFGLNIQNTEKILNVGEISCAQKIKQ